MGAGTPADDSTGPPTLREAIEGLVVSLFIINGLVRIGRMTSLDGWIQTLELAAWTLPAWLIALRRGRDPLEFYALDRRPRRLGESLVALLAVAAWAALMQLWLLPRDTLPAASELLRTLILQIALVAFPEELLFRGLAQPALARRGPVVGIVGGAVLFALAHVIVLPSPDRLLVVFPGLLFGLLRERTGSLWPSILLHALCNLVYFVWPLSALL